MRRRCSSKTEDSFPAPPPSGRISVCNRLQVRSNGPNSVGGQGTTRERSKRSENLIVSLEFKINSVLLKVTGLGARRLNLEGLFSELKLLLFVFEAKDGDINKYGLRAAMKEEE